MSIVPHPTHEGWWQVKYYPKGKIGGIKVVTVKGNREAALDKEVELKELSAYDGELSGKSYLPSIKYIPVDDGSFVYFIQQGEDGPIKIGYATNVSKRLSGIQVCNPYKLKLVCLIENGNRRTEEGIHLKFKGLKLYGEWFRPRKELLDYIRNLNKTSQKEKLIEIQAMALDILSIGNISPADIVSFVFSGNTDQKDNLLTIAKKYETGMKVSFQ